MTHYWLGVLTGLGIAWALTTITLVAIRGAERSTPMASGHWPTDDEDDIEAAHRRLLEQDAA